LKSLLNTISFPQINDLLLDSSPRQYLEKIIQTNLTSKELYSFIQELKNLRTKNIISTRVRGIEKTNKEGDTVLFPLEEGEYLKFTIQHALDIIANEEMITEENLTVRLEILNGTEINKLALNTANLFKKYGYQIDFFGNAEKHDYDSTIVIDRKGKKDITQKIADLIKCKNIISQITQEQSSLVDVTIILGKDFDGQYCK
jgi:hypothetical protein